MSAPEEQNNEVPVQDDKPRKERKKEEKSRNWFGTINNYTDEDEKRLQEVEVRFVRYGREVSASGTPHLQVFLQYQYEVTMSRLKKKWPRGHFERCRSKMASFHYCGKDEDIYERGVPPKDPAQVGLDEKKRWSDARKAAEEGRFEDIPDDIYVRYVRNLEYIAAKHRPEPKQLEGPRGMKYGIWVYGPPDCGKSSWASDTYPGAYKKTLDKWWDGYTVQEFVHLDEISPRNSQYLSDYIKIWADRYPFRAHVKGSSMMMRPRLMIVTSNHTIEDCFGFDPVLATAIRRRFDVRRMDADGTFHDMNVGTSSAASELAEKFSFL